MEERMRRRRQTQTSPERTKVWAERSPEHRQIRKVPVVYYLCKNQHMEHPHYIEVPLSSPDGLYLRDVVNRLDNLRGRGMHLKYAWSSKRSYKTGYVWHDLSDEDVIIPVNGMSTSLKVRSSIRTLILALLVQVESVLCKMLNNYSNQTLPKV